LKKTDQTEKRAASCSPSQKVYGAPLPKGGKEKEGEASVLGKGKGEAASVEMFSHLHRDATQGGGGGRRKKRFLGGTVGYVGCGGQD